MDLFTSSPFPNLRKASFLHRPNRFVIVCDLDGEIVTAHLPNPGRLWELLLPGRTVFLMPNDAASMRSTHYTAVAVERDGFPILLHTHMANSVVQCLLKQGLLPGLEDAVIIRREATFGRSRFDFLLERKNSQIILEVKSCTLFGKALAMFPDAVTDRGRKHLLELAELARRGYACAVVFVVSAPRAQYFIPDYHTDADFARTVRDVRESVQIQAVGIEWHEDLTLSKTIRPIPLLWPLLEKENRDRGCYILILRLDEDRTLNVGGLGRIFFPKGHYLYVGSAKKNLEARMERHKRRRKTFFWHIDYLRDAASACQALPVRTQDDLEHELARRLAPLADWIIPGFGASDSPCESHLFAMKNNPVHHPAFIDLLQYFRMDRLAPFPNAASEEL